MHNYLLEDHKISSLHSCRIWLPASWCAGLSLGIAFAYCSDIFSSLMYSAPYSPVSIVGLCAVLLVPYLLTAFAVLISQPWMLVLLAFCKAFVFSACCAGSDLAFGNAGWIIRVLLFFSDLASVPVLYWLWLRCLDDNRKQLYGTFTAALAIFVLIGSIDYLVIAPFLASVI